MPVMAVCPSCGKSYQAPDSMAGKSVRCKQCQTVFKIDQPDTFGDDVGGSEVDFDQLQRSFEGEDSDATAAGTRVGGPMIDKDGRASIRRAADVAAMRVRGEQAGGGMRTNLRFRYPFARQVDVGLPFLIVLLAIAIPLWLSLTTGAKPDEKPDAGVGISRYVVLLVAFVVCVVPLVHIAATKASEALHFNLPRNPMWRSFASACATMLLASTLFILAGGGLGGVIMGILVGACATVAASLLLYRAIPQEMGLLSAYVGIATAVGAAAAALIIGGVNFAAASIARSQENPTLFQSPIAIGAPWVEQKQVVAGPVKPKPTSPKAVDAKPTPSAPNVPAVVSVPTTPQPVPMAMDQFIADAEARKFVKSADQLPVGAGFQTIVTTLTPSPTLGVIRSVAGGVVELWNTDRWALPGGAIGRNFDYRQAPLFCNATGDRVVRLVTSPYLRIETIALASGGAPMVPVKLENDAQREIAGFLDDSVLIVRSQSSAGLKLEQYDLKLSPAKTNPDAPAIGTMDPIEQTSKPMNVDLSGRAIAYLPERQVVVAGRDFNRNKPACLARFSLDRLGEPEYLCDVPWEPNVPFTPLAMAASPSGRVALLMNTNGEAWLSIWRLKDEEVDGATLPASPTWLAEGKIGGIGALRSNSRWEGADDALIWLDRDTLLLYGQYIIDSRTTQMLGSVKLPDATGLVWLRDGEVAYSIQSGGLKSLIRVKFDLDYIASQRPKLPAAN